MKQDPFHGSESDATRYWEPVYTGRLKKRAYETSVLGIRRPKWGFLRQSLDFDCKRIKKALSAPTLNGSLGLACQEVLIANWVLSVLKTGQSARFLNSRCAVALSERLPQFSLRSRTPSVNGSYCSPYSSLTRKVRHTPLYSLVVRFTCTAESRCWSKSGLVMSNLKDQKHADDRWHCFRVDSNRRKMLIKLVEKKLVGKYTGGKKRMKIKTVEK